MDIKTNAPTKKGNETQKKIFNAALNLIKEKGYDETTLVEICRVAEVSNGTFYHHFKSKQDILLGYVRNESIELDEYYKSISKDSYLEALNQVIDWQIDYYLIKGYEFIANLYSTIVLSRYDDWATDEYSLIPILNDCFKKGQEKGTFSKDIEAKIMADTLFHIIYSVTTNWCIENGKIDLRKALMRCLVPQINLYKSN